MSLCMFLCISGLGGDPRPNTNGWNAPFDVARPWLMVRPSRSTAGVLLHHPAFSLISVGDGQLQPMRALASYFTRV